MHQPGSSDQLVPKDIKATAVDIVPALKEEAGKLAKVGRRRCRGSAGGRQGGRERG